jgi:hypothetical protein
MKRRDNARLHPPILMAGPRLFANSFMFLPEAVTTVRHMNPAVRIHERA